MEIRKRKKLSIEDHILTANYICVYYLLIVLSKNLIPFLQDELRKRVKQEHKRIDDENVGQKGNTKSTSSPKTKAKH